MKILSSPLTFDINYVILTNHQIVALHFISGKSFIFCWMHFKNVQLGSGRQWETEAHTTWNFFNQHPRGDSKVAVTHNYTWKYSYVWLRIFCIRHSPHLNQLHITVNWHWLRSCFSEVPNVCHQLQLKFWVLSLSEYQNLWVQTK